jgi:hypothetical protein
MYLLSKKLWILCKYFLCYRLTSHVVLLGVTVAWGGYDSSWRDEKPVHKFLWLNCFKRYYVEDGDGKGVVILKIVLNL